MRWDGKMEIHMSPKSIFRGKQVKHFRMMTEILPVLNHGPKKWKNLIAGDESWIS
jgi:hypothetical protein